MSKGDTESSEASRAADGGELGRRERKKLETRARIRDAAWTLFVTQGYEATTTKEVAAEAGIAAGTLFNYAPDKTDLLFMVFEERLRRCVDEAFVLLPPEGPLLGQLMALFGPLFAMYAEHPEVSAQFVRAIPGARGPNAQAVHGLTMAFVTRVAGLITDGQSRGELGAHVPPMLAAANFFSLYYGALQSWLSGMVTLEIALDPTLRSSLALHIRGLLPEEG